MKEYSYNLIRSGRKTVSLEITAKCELLVRAPNRMTQGEIDRFVQKHTDWIDAHLEKVLRCAQTHPEPTDAERKLWIARAADYLPERVSNFGSLMGLSPAGITITGAKTRFGSCSPKNRLCFSWRLMRYPNEAIDYVVVHELAHIAHKNHGKAFYYLVASVMPDYPERRKLLRQ